MGTITKAFLWNQVSGEFYDTRTYNKDKQTDDLQAAMEKAMGYKNSFFGTLAQTMVFTKNMTFAWREEATPGFRALETFWRSFQSGVPIKEWLEYYLENVDNLVMLGRNEQYRIERLTDEDLKLPALAGRLTHDDGIAYKSIKTSEKVIGWNQCVREVLMGWQPPDSWKLISELPLEQQTDPLS